MKNLIFLSGEDLLDVDMPVVQKIHTHYNFTWVIVLKGYGWFKQEDLELFCCENGIKHYIILQKTKLKNPKTFLTHIKVLRLLKKLNADIIYDSYLGMPYMHYVTPLFVKRNKFVIAIHDVVQHYNMGNRNIRAFYYDFLMNNYSKIHLFSKNQYEIFTQKFKNKNILLAPLALKNFGQPIDDVTQSKDNSLTNFLIFGIIRENKGVDLLIKAANQLATKYDNFTITIAGKSMGNCWEMYKDLIHNQDRFELIIRQIEPREVQSLLSKADFMVLPYRDVTQSGVLLSAYNYKLPVIASNLPGFDEYISDSETGYFFESENIESLTSKMEIALTLSDEKRQHMRDKLEQFVSTEISIDAIAKKYITYFDSLN